MQPQSELDLWFFNISSLVPPLLDNEWEAASSLPDPCFYSVSRFRAILNGWGYLKFNFSVIKEFIFIYPRTAKELRTLLPSLYSEKQNKTKTNHPKPRELNNFFQWYAEMPRRLQPTSPPANQVGFFTYHNYSLVCLVWAMELFPYESIFKTWDMRKGNHVPWSIAANLLSSWWAVSNADIEQKGHRVNEEPCVKWTAMYSHGWQYPGTGGESGIPQKRMNDRTQRRTDLTGMENKVVLMLGEQVLQP